MRTHRIARFVAILLFLVALVYFVIGTVVGLLVWTRGLGAGWGTGFSGWIAIPILISTLFGAVTLLLFGVILYFLTQIDTNLAMIRTTWPQPKKVPPPAAPETAMPYVPPEPPPAPAEPIAVAAPAATAVAAAAAVTAEQPAPSTEVPEAPAAAEASAEIEASAPAAAETPVGTETPITAEAPAVPAAPPAEEAPTSPSETETPAPPSPAEPPPSDVAAPETPGSVLPQAEIVEEAAEVLPEVPAARPAIEAELPALAEEEPPTEEFTGRLPGADEASRIASELAATKDTDKKE